MSLATVIYYLIYAASIIALQLMFVSLGIINKFDLSKGIGVNSTIFLFVMGIVFVRQIFYFGTSNCVSRKSMFLAMMGLFFLLGLSTAALDVLLNAGNNLNGYIISTQGSMGEALLLSFINYFGVIMAGAFVSLLYYRMSKLAKWIVSAGAIASVVFGPFVLMFVAMTQNSLVIKVGEVILDFLRFAIDSYWNAMLVQLVLAVIITGVCFVIFRKMPVKENTVA